MIKGHFDWDPNKDRENQQKHGVSFSEAQYAFADSRRVIAEDVSHSDKEKRYYCFGKVGGGVLTVRFTFRNDVIRIIGAGYWRKGKAIYRAKIKYTDEPLGEVKIISDFLPSPDELAFREESVKVTISLSKRSVEFFKAQATKHHTQYQRMIRQLLDAYVDAQSRSAAFRSTRTTPKRPHGRRCRQFHRDRPQAS